MKATDPDENEVLKRRIAELEAILKASGQTAVNRSGAVAQGGGDALGQHSVKVENANSGTINTGTQIVNHYYAACNQRLTKEEIARRVGSYLEWLVERTQSIALRGIERAGGAAVVILPLETAYVPLRAKPLPRLDSAQARADFERMKDGADFEREADIALNQMLGLGNRLAITGGPGSGKTTVLLHMAWALATSLLADNPEPARSRLGLTVAPSELPLPIFVPLASFARRRRELPGNAPPQETTLTRYITHHLIRSHAEFDLPDDFFVQLLKDGRNVVLLLDGLDEVADEDERAQVRQSVEELVSGRPALRVIVTCRTIAYRSGRTALGADFREIAVQPLDPQLHIAPMVRQAYACIHPHDATLRDGRAEDLLRGILALEETRRARLGKDADALVDSPLMVRLLLIVHVNERTLPDERAVLFEKAINALLQVDYGREESNNSDLAKDWKPYRDMAQHLAYHMHRQGSDQGREIEEAALKRALREEETFIARIDGFLSHARQRGSVLEERNGVYRFIHLAFQEFLVARYLREVIGGKGHAAILAQIGALLDDPWWREPLLLLGGYWAAHSSQAAREFLIELAAAGSTPDTWFSATELAGTAVLEWRDGGATLRAVCAQRIVALLGDSAALQGSKPIIRARAGDVLAALGDPRFDPRCCHLPGDDSLGFELIPADPDFCIGTRKKDAQRIGASEDEINDKPISTREFYLARYPVTVAQFREFAGTTGFKLGDNDALRAPDNRPVTDVSWRDALAYCDWLNATLAALPDNKIAQLIRDGWRIGLPSELEWEKAARGGLRDKAYPWGDEPDANRANYHDTGIGATSAVGCFPANGYGLHDMSGNVWEWTRSLWGKDSQKPEFVYPYDPEDRRREDMDAGDDVYRVVRGGGWIDHPVSARCASSNRFHPVGRNFSLGFRVVLRSSPVFPL